MPNTSRYAIPYPSAVDSPNGPAQMQALATQVDTSMGAVQDAAAAATAATNATVAALAPWGEWTLTANLIIGTPTLITTWTAVGTPAGISNSGGQFTVTQAGVYTISLGIRFTNATADKYAYITTTNSATGTVIGKNSTSGSANVGVSITHRFAAGATFFCWGYAGVSSSATHETGGDLVTGVTAYRVGN